MGVVFGADAASGSAIARRLAREGLSIAAVAAAIDTLHRHTDDASELPGPRIDLSCDPTRPDQVAEILDRVSHTLGPIDVVVFHAALDAESLAAGWEASSTGLYHVVRHILPALRARGAGVIGVVGAPDEMPQASLSSALQRACAALRSLTDSIASELAAEGIRVFYDIDSEGAERPDSFAERVWEQIYPSASSPQIVSQLSTPVVRALAASHPLSHRAR